MILHTKMMIYRYINNILPSSQKSYQYLTENGSTESLIHTEYYPILCLFIFSVILTLLILILSYNFVNQNPETEKLSSYECGFEPYDDARNTFDIKFYIVGILFLIFDIETVFLFPWSVSISRIDVLGYWSMIDFIYELGIGFAYVWMMNAIDWQ